MSQKPKKKKTPQKSSPLNIVDWLFIITTIITTIITLVIDHNHPPLYIIADISALIFGVIYMLLSVKGYRSSFIFSIFSAAAFAYIAWSNHFYGNVAVNLFYYIPCALIGFHLWGKHSNKNHEVKARKLTSAQSLLVVIALIIATIVLKLTLDAVGGASTFLDSATATLTFTANLLVLLRYREQWLLWLLVDAFQLIMWAATNDPVMIVIRVLYPLSAIYGYVYWKKLIKPSRNRNKS